MSKYLLGIDNGGTMTKAAIFNLRGREMAVASLKTPLKIPKPDYAQRDMLELWDANTAVIKDAIKAAGINPADILGVSCTGHGKGLYLWGNDDKPAYDGIASTDSRAQSYIKEWNASGVSAKAAKKTLQYPIACHPVALLAWFKDNEPEVYSNIKWIFEAKDFTRFMLTGEAYAEATDYSGTCMMNLLTSKFDKHLLKLFGISDMYDKIPPLKYSADICGYVTAEAAAQTGLKEGTPVSGGMFDIDACAIAMDVSDAEKLCVITGTWSINEYISPNPIFGQKSTMNSLFCIPGYYLIEESSPTSAGNLEWFMEQLNDFAKTDIKYRKADEGVQAINADECDVYFIPFLYGTNNPDLTSASFLGIKNNHTFNHMLRAIFEGVAFSHKEHIDKLLETRPTPSAVRLAGGVVNSKVWVQIFADVIGIPVETVGVKELGTLGCSISAAVAAGVYKSYKKAAAEMVKLNETIYPNMKNHEIYMAKYTRYKKYIKALSGV